MTYRAVDTYRNLNLAVVVKENFPLGVAVRNPETLALHPVPGMEDTYAKTLQCFEEEAELLSTLTHTNIVRVSAHFSELNTAYYVMPHIGGTELQKALPSPDKLSEADLLPILRCLLKTLHYMHGYNLMHRDIKPTNILIDDKGTPILIDFGLVRSTESTHTLTRNYTPGYAPVEQISGKGKSGPWTDLYSLGATCYALITGDAPPDALDRLEEDEYTPLQSRSELQSRYSPALLSGIDRALQVKRADRWQSAQEWLDDMQKFTSKPIITVPEPVTVVPTQLTHEQQAQLALQERNINIGEYESKLISAIENADTELLNLLIAAGADVNYADEDGWTPLYNAAWEGQTECVKLLLAAPDIDVNKATNNGWTPLYNAAWEGQTECVKLLLAAPPIDVNKANNDGTTPLNKAAWKGHSECVKLLLAAPGIDVNKADNDGWTPLYWAAREGHSECVKLLLAAPGIDVNKANKYGWTPLYNAAWEGQTECVKLLLAAPGIDVNKADNDGDTPLYMAAWKGHVECVRLLLAAPGIEVNKANKYGWTPLYWAANKGHSECVQLLLAAPGIDVNKADEYGGTPLHEAESEGHTECVLLIRAAGGK